MADPRQLELASATAPLSSEANEAGPWQLDLLIDRPCGEVRLEWRSRTSGGLIARVVARAQASVIGFRQACWTTEIFGRTTESLSSAHPSGVRAKLNRLKQAWPVADADVSARAMHSFGDDLAAARREYDQVKQLDETLFAKDYESI